MSYSKHSVTNYCNLRLYVPRDVLCGHCHLVNFANFCHTQHRTGSVAGLSEGEVEN